LSKDEGEGAALSGPDVETSRTASTSDDSGGAVDPVGYRRPPKHSQFAKGRTGNPNGRPKGVRNFATVIEAELNTKIPITENGKRKSISKREAVAKQLVNKAASGDTQGDPPSPERIPRPRENRHRTGSRSRPERGRPSGHDGHAGADPPKHGCPSSTRGAGTPLCAIGYRFGTASD
jgi:hypothetical protein